MDCPTSGAFHRTCAYSTVLSLEDPARLNMASRSGKSYASSKRSSRSSSSTQFRRLEAEAELQRTVIEEERLKVQEMRLKLEEERLKVKMRALEARLELKRAELEEDLATRSEVSASEEESEDSKSPKPYPLEHERTPPKDIAR